jgi:DNA-binding winged helix-turn-helix (wHTH) protein/Tol biopolymer transport system component
MASPVRLISRFRFGAFELDAASGELRKSGMPIKLRLQAAQVLLLLAERSGHIVTREEIRDRLWSANTFVDFERGINFCVNQIRAALGDDAEKPRYVETLPRRGYRFIAPVTVELPKEPALTVAPPSTTAELHRGAIEFNTSSPETAVLRLVSPRLVQVSLGPWVRNHFLAIGVALILVSLAVGFASHKWLSRGRGLNYQNFRITKLTDNGKITDVAISPDGHYVIYARSEGEKEGLWMRQVATRSDVQILPPENASFHGLTFSPDGNYIYFVSTDPNANDPFFKYLFVMPVLGGSARKLLTDVDSPVSFSPDNRQLVFERCVAADNHIEIRVANADGGGDALLTTIRNASCFMYQPGLSWSQDGRTLAVPVKHFGNPGRWVLYTVSMPDGNARELYSSPTGFGKPVWLPDGNALLVAHYDQVAHRSQLWTVSYPKGQPRRLSNDLSDYEVSLDMTRNGDTVAAVASTAVSNVWVFAGADPTQGRQITSGNLPMFDVAENPDGRILSASGDGALWVTNTDGTRHVLFADLSDAGWITPCAHSVVFTSFKAGIVTLIDVDTDGANAKELASGSLWSPACSPDGRFVFYVTVDSPQIIWRIPIEGGARTEIAKVQGDSISGRMSVSPDGQFISYPYTQYTNSPSGGWALAVIPVGGGPPIKSFHLVTGFVGARWSPQGNGLQYMLTQNGVTNIWEQPLTGGSPKQITKFTSGQIFDFNWTADARQLLLTRGETTSDVILLTNIQ